MNNTQTHNDMTHNELCLEYKRTKSWDIAQKLLVMNPTWDYYNLNDVLNHPPKDFCV